MSGIVRLQRRLHGGINRIEWRAEDLVRLARHYDYTGPIALLSTRRVAMPLVLDLPATVERSEGAPQVYTWTVSTGATDHMNDQIAVDGWDLGTHRSNPVVQYAHAADMLPIGRAISTTVEGRRLVSRMMFSSDAFAQRVKRMVDEGNLKAASVGFIPGSEWKFTADPKRPNGIDFIRGHRLLEWSIVNIPANPQALLLGSGDASAAQLVAASPVELSADALAMGRRVAERRARASAA